MRNLAALMGAKPNVNHGRSIERAAFAKYLAAVHMAVEGPDPQLIAKKRWPDDETVQALLSRAAVSGATTTQAGWAAELVQDAFGDFLDSLAPISAASRLRELGLNVPMADVANFKAPTRGTGMLGVPWVAEGFPIPARQYDFNFATLTPKKFAVITAASKELFKRTKAQAILTALLREDAAYALDSAYFSTGATSAAAHPGLLDPAAAQSVTASTAGGRQAFEEDLQALLEVVMAGGSGKVVYVTGTVTAEVLRVRFPDFVRDAIVLPSPAVPNSRFIALDPASIVHTADGEPDIDVVTEGAIVLNDTPAQVGTAGSPNVAAAPTVSLYQSNMVAIRIMGQLAFTARRTGVAAYVDNFDWSETP